MLVLSVLLVLCVAPVSAIAEEVLVEEDEVVAGTVADANVEVLEPTSEPQSELQSDSVALTTQMSPQGYFAKSDAFLSDSRWCDGASWGWQTPYLSEWQSWQCYAYACDFTAYMYGIDNYEDGTYFSSVSEIRTGDVIRANGHTFVVIERIGNDLRTAEGNYIARVRVANPGYRISGNSIVQVGSSRTYTIQGGYHFSTGGATTRTAAGLEPGEPARIPMSDATISLSRDSYTFTGKKCKPKVYVSLDGSTLTKGTDYKVSYKANVNAGTARVVVTGMGNYEGTSVKAFTISPRDVNELTVSKIKAKKYTGNAIKPTPKVLYGGVALLKGTDFSVSYKRNKKAGTAMVTIKGMGNYAGSRKVKFTIRQASIQGAKLKLSKKKFEYTGKVRRPKVVTVDGKELKVGIDYEVRYSKKKSKKVGKYKIWVVGKGNYKGTSAKATYKIVNPAPKSEPAPAPTPSPEPVPEPETSNETYAV